MNEYKHFIRFCQLARGKRNTVKSLQWFARLLLSFILLDIPDEQKTQPFFILIMLGFSIRCVN